jgi:8-oxo-dGTP pyrophosphatase MutT (NUDIX family)
MSSSRESEEYELISLEESLKLNESKHASHCLLYCREETKHFDAFFALLQLRFDGLIGFPGGEVDEHHISVESIIEATTRELCEEINYKYESVVQNDWICSHRKRNSAFVQHFFAKQLSAEQFKQIERTHMNAEHFPSESLGIYYSID